uniref:Putative helicase n=1 Tax=viral metagenome TaxID=1070528 RepID=A0A6M3X6N7_9ZZZZ
MTSTSAAVVLQPYWNDSIAEAVVARVRGGQLPGLVFVQLKEHGRLLSELLSRELGHAVPLVTGDLPEPQSAKLARTIKETPNACPVAVCTSTWATGIDIPNLRWVLWAGQGQAPIGFLQARGRGSRSDQGKKADFELIVVEDLETPRYREQAVKRIDHMRRAGYEVCSDELLQQLLDKPATTGHRRGRGLSQGRGHGSGSGSGRASRSRVPGFAPVKPDGWHSADSPTGSTLGDVIFILLHTRWFVVSASLLVLMTIIKGLLN